MDLRNRKLPGSQDVHSSDESPEETSTHNSDRGDAGVTRQEDPQIQLGDLMQFMRNMEKNITERLDNKMEENNQNMTQNIKETNEKVLRKIEENDERMKQRMEENRRELMEMAQKMKENLEAQIRTNQEEVFNIKKEVDAIGLRVLQESRESDQRLETLNTNMELIAERIQNDLAGHKEELREEINKMENNGQVKLGRLKQQVNENGQRITNLEKEIQDGQKTEDIEFRTENRIRQLEEDLRKEMENRVVRERIVMTSCSNQSTLKFDGDIKKVHPKIFINILRNKISLNLPLQNLREAIRENLNGNALLWFASRELRINNFDDFQQQFLNYYWGEHTQSLAREKLYFGRFDHNRGTSMNNYALTLYTLVQHLDPPMREDEIVVYIARQFRSDMAETITILGINNMNQLTNYLQRIERNRNRNHNDRNNRVNNNQNQRNYEQNRTYNYNNNYNYNRNNQQRNNNYPNTNGYNYPNQRNNYNRYNNNNNYNNGNRHSENNDNRGHEQRNRSGRRNSEGDINPRNRLVNFQRREGSLENEGRERRGAVGNQNQEENIESISVQDF